MQRTIWMFAGQGSHYRRMGRDLFESEPVFREFIERGDAVVRRMVNASVVDALYRTDPAGGGAFDQTQLTHPSILMVECALSRLLMDRGLKPDLLFGFSLGEITALVVGGALSFEEALVAVVKQGVLIDYCVPRGGMVAVLESDDLFHRNPAAFDGCELAGVSFARSFVLSGSIKSIGNAERFLKERGVNWLRLPVSRAFHSMAIDRVKTPIRSTMDSLKFGLVEIPIFSAERGAMIETTSVDRLWDAMRNPINFSRAIGELERLGPWLYVDLGPSGSLATAVKYNLNPGSRSKFASIMTPFGHDRANVGRLLEAVATST